MAINSYDLNHTLASVRVFCRRDDDETQICPYYRKSPDSDACRNSVTVYRYCCSRSAMQEALLATIYELMRSSIESRKEEIEAELERKEADNA